MGIFKREHKGGFADVIRCDQKHYLIWKWHPDKYPEGTLKRETAIRASSVVRVKTGEVCVFVYKKQDGSNEDYIVGPHDDVIKTKNFPILSSLIGLWYEGDTPFQAEVFFINVAEDIQINFGVPYFDVIDPRYPDFTVPVAARGTITFKIEDYRRFVIMHQLATFNLDNLKSQVNSAVCRYVKDAIIQAPTENNMSVLGIESKIDLINEKAELNIKERLLELFGITVTGLDISAIEVDKESEGYFELKRITKDIVSKKTEVDFEHYKEQLRIQREEGQYAQHKATQQANLGAYQTEKQAEVGVASAEALGKMGENGAGDIDLGGHHSGAGFNPMTIMAGLAVGGAVAKNLSGTLDQSMNVNSGSVPPIPKTVYYLAVNNQPVGPFEKEMVVEKILSGEINKESLLWKSGTPTWEKASSFEEFKSNFPPEIVK